MTLETAEKIAQFVAANGIERLNIMGGEFFVHPVWQEIIHTLASAVLVVRLVSNGDWAGAPITARQVIDFLRAHPNIYVSLSKDPWHTNKHVVKAAALLQHHKILHNIATKDATTEDSIVPAGRGELYYGTYSIFHTYCSKPDRKYEFLIDEQGEIYKCGYGIWDYDNIDMYLHGGFRERFKDFGQRFYNAFVGNCAMCVRGYHSSGRRPRKR